MRKPGRSDAQKVADHVRQVAPSTSEVRDVREVSITCASCHLSLLFIPVDFNVVPGGATLADVRATVEALHTGCDPADITVEFSPATV